MQSHSIKEPVRLRQKPIDNGCISLYLDIYYMGKRKYEFLRLYLIPEHSKADRVKNEETLQLAYAVKAKRITEVQSGAYGFGENKAKSTPFFTYFDYVMNTKKRVQGTYNLWILCRKHIVKYVGNSTKQLTMNDITHKWVQGFKHYLEEEAVCLNKTDRPLSKNTQATYCMILYTCLHQAYKEDIFTSDPCKAVRGISKAESRRQYLTPDELKRLIATPCHSQEIRRAFLFSCFTGLRKSDVERLTYNEIQHYGDFTRIVFKQKKTSGQEYLDISPQAVALLNTPSDEKEFVFTLPSIPLIEKTLAKWCSQAGITKHITFHCARHTFAVMMLDLGADIYTVSKLLGHRELSTTQIYAKILDKNKQKAVSMIPDFLGLNET